MQRRPGFPAKLPGASNAPAAKPQHLARSGQRVAVPARWARELILRRACPHGAKAGTAAGHYSAPGCYGAMGAVERHRFVDSALGNQAYEDLGLAHRHGADHLNSIVARMCGIWVLKVRARVGWGVFWKLARAVATRRRC